MRHQHGGLLEGRDQHVGQLRDRLILDDAHGDGVADLLVDEGDAVVLLDRAKVLPAQHHRTVEQDDALHLGFECRFEESV